MTKTIDRWQSESVKRALSERRVVLLAGARQCGKTTLARNLDQKGLEYRTLDERAMLEAARADPESFVAHDGQTLIIDEIQRAPELLPAIKRVVDQEMRPGQYLLTGSASLSSIPSAQESLAGRVARVRLRPFSQGEMEGSHPGALEELFSETVGTPLPTTSRDDLLQRAFRGGYPEAISLPERSRTGWHQDYVNALLERDLKDLVRIQRLDAMRNLLVVLAAWSSQYMDISKITSRLSIKRPTVETYISALEALFLAERVPAWTSTDYERVGSKDKLFVTDTGLMAAILDWRIDQVRFDSDRSGKLAETFVFTELMAQIDASDDYRLFHYRDWEQRELDFLVERRSDGALLGIEVKASQSATRDHFKHLEWFRDNLAKDRPFQGCVLYTGSSALSFGDRLRAIPMSIFWS
jgi:predicted AAA+ superfamily ATPase